MRYGYYAKAKFADADENFVLYVYYCYDNNKDGWEQYREKYDGEILLKKPKGNKPDVSIYDMTVKNASGWWECSYETADSMSLRLVKRIGEQLRETGEWPWTVAVFVPYKKCK